MSKANTKSNDSCLVKLGRADNYKLSVYTVGRQIIQV